MSLVNPRIGVIWADVGGAGIVGYTGGGGLSVSVLGSTLRNVISLTNVSFIGNDIRSATSDGGGALITFLSDVEPTSTGDPRLVLVLDDVLFINNSVGT